MVLWDKHTHPSGTIDLINAFDELIDFHNPKTDTGEQYRKAETFLRNLQSLTEITNTNVAALALVQALHIYDPARRL